MTPTRTEFSTADLPEVVTILSRERIVETPANALDDVLRTVPSVNLPFVSSYQVHPTAGSVSMRGLGGIRALVLGDGVPLNDPFFGYVQWNQVPMGNIERVEIVPGGGPPLWGNYAMGGVINLITRVPKQQEVGAEGGYGNYNTYRGNGYTELTLSDSVKTRTYLGGWGTAGYDQVAGSFGPIYVPTSFAAQNAEVSTYFDPDAILRGYVRFNFYNNSQTLTTPLQTNNQQTSLLSG